MSLGRLIFNTTDSETIADSHHVGAHTLSGIGALITSGDNDNDNLSTTTIEALDIRGFNYIYDSTGDNWDRLQGVNGAVKVYIDDGDFEVDVVIRAEKAEDSIHTTGDFGNYILGVRLDDIDGANSALLAGNNGDYQSFFTDDKGQLWVRDKDVADLLTTIDVDTGNIDTKLGSIIYAEDSIHTTGDEGVFGLSIRIDDISADNSALLAGSNGDYQGFFTNDKGALYVTMAGEPDDDVALANTAIAHNQQAASVDNTAENSVDSILSGRKYLFLANEGNKLFAIGSTGVTVETGFPVHPGSYIGLRAGASVNVQWAARKATGSDLRSLELS